MPTKNKKNSGRKKSSYKPKRKISKRSSKAKSRPKPKRGKRSTKKNYGCVNLSHLKKYSSNKRKSPPYPANECGGLTKIGRDGSRYKSKKNSRGIYQWRKV